MLHSGLYEQVINSHLSNELAQAPEVRKSVAPIDKAEASKILTQYLSDVVRGDWPIPAKFLKKTNKPVVG